MFHVSREAWFLNNSKGYEEVQWKRQYVYFCHLLKKSRCDKECCITWNRICIREEEMHMLCTYSEREIYSHERTCTHSIQQSKTYIYVIQGGETNFAWEISKGNKSLSPKPFIGRSRGSQGRSWVSATVQTVHLAGPTSCWPSHHTLADCFMLLRLALLLKIHRSLAKSAPTFCSTSVPPTATCFELQTTIG